MRKLKTILLFSLLIIIFSPAIALAQSGTFNLPADGFKYLCNDLSKYKDNESFCTSKGQRVPTSAEINATVLPCGSSANKCGGNQVPVCCYGGLITSQTVPPKKPLFVIPVPEVSIPTVKLTEAICELNTSTKLYVCAVPWIGEYINGIYKYGINIAGILAALVLMGGGLLWLISGGDASKITKAKEMIIGSVTGLIILMSSYIILTQINPDLVKMKSITLGYMAKQDTDLAKAKLGTDAEKYKNSGCPTDTELTNGVEFYATGYFKMPWQANQDKRYLCMVHMQGTCPNGVDTASNCVENGKPIFSGYPNYQPCRQFTQDQYANYFNRPNLIVGQTIAGPIECGGDLGMNKQVCFNNHTYTITDSGGGIKGKRIDILSSSETGAINNTGTGILRKGACSDNPIVYGTFSAADWVSRGGKFDPNVALQAGNASPELSQLLNCMRSKLASGVGTISSISDSNHVNNLSACNQANCPSNCAHTCGSCHYGGASGNQSYAVDFGDETNSNALLAAAKSCASDIKSLYEGNHLHLSVSKCSGT